MCRKISRIIGSKEKKMPKKISKQKSINRAKTITELTVAVVILATAGILIKSGVDNSKSIKKSQYVDTESSNTVEIPDTTVEQDPNKIIFVTKEFPTRDKFKGDLILVNNDYEYFSDGDEDLVSVLEMNAETERTHFTAVDNTYMILRPVYEPMATMIDDFYDLYNNDTLIIYGSYRTNDFQKQLYDEFTASTSGDGDAPIVAKPGYSEHETGYAFDFSETVNLDYQGTGDFAWINENSYKYGFIVRYPKDKEDITEFRYEPWHFRYVGIPHAGYMSANNLCLEEYIDRLRESYSYSGEHLEFSDGSGANYEVYFYPSDDSSEITNVAVPSGYRYDISGNNVDGFIVTVHKDEPVAFGDENPSLTTTAAETTESTETTTTIAQ